MLTDVPEIDQADLQNIYSYAIDSGTNVLILGPSGGGKTQMCFSVIAKKKCRPIYINMSVLERVDFQGLPVISDDNKTVNYACPDFLPFVDVKVRKQKEAINTMISWLNKQPNKNIDSLDKFDAIKFLEGEISKIDAEEEIKLLKQSANSLPNNETFNELKGRINGLDQSVNEETPIVIMFDEVDKGMTEVLNTLLEFLQFGSINGRKLNIRTCIMTANMPDEFAHSNQISHAITKRGLTFQLKLNFEQWVSWAVNNGISPLITGFLRQNNSYLYKTANGDDTAYALPSPRTWEIANKVIKFFEKEKEENINEELRLKLVSGAVGSTAAIHFNNWYKHYHQLDPFINDLMEKGVYPTKTKPDMATEDIFICALSACSKVESVLKPDNRPQIEKYVKNAFNWLATLPPDVQVGSIRMVFGGNFNASKGLEGVIQKYKLSEIPEFTNVFIDIDKNFRKWEKLNAERSAELSKSK